LPVGLLAPFIHLGAHKKHPCDIQSIGQLGLNIPASEYPIGPKSNSDAINVQLTG
jgi:hypothetical protein